jgi:very-short-patch-repair endonuclease
MENALARQRELRGRATDAERLLWRLLRSRQFLGLKFRRQHPVGPYIVDFYCAVRKLVVELDGGQHFTIEGQAYDRRRTEYLAMRGIRVLRFTNSELFENTDGVLEIIRQSTGAQGLVTPHPVPLPG